MVELYHRLGFQGDNLAVLSALTVGDKEEFERGYAGNLFNCRRQSCTGTFRTSYRLAFYFIFVFLLLLWEAVGGF